MFLIKFILLSIQTIRSAGNICTTHTLAQGCLEDVNCFWHAATRTCEDLTQYHHDEEVSSTMPPNIIPPRRPNEDPGERTLGLSIHQIPGVDANRLVSAVPVDSVQSISASQLTNLSTWQDWLRTLVDKMHFEPDPYKTLYPTMYQDDYYYDYLQYLNRITYGPSDSGQYQPRTQPVNIQPNMYPQNNQPQSNQYVPQIPYRPNQYKYTPPNSQPNRPFQPQPNQNPQQQPQTNPYPQQNTNPYPGNNQYIPPYSGNNQQPYYYGPNQPYNNQPNQPYPMNGPILYPNGPQLTPAPPGKNPNIYLRCKAYHEEECYRDVEDNCFWNVDATPDPGCRYYVPSAGGEGQPADMEDCTLIKSEMKCHEATPPGTLCWWDSKFHMCEEAEECEDFPDETQCNGAEFTEQAITCTWTEGAGCDESAVLMKSQPSESSTDSADPIMYFSLVLFGCAVCLLAAVIVYISLSFYDKWTETKPSLELDANLVSQI